VFISFVEKISRLVGRVERTVFVEDTNNGEDLESIRLETWRP